MTRSQTLKTERGGVQDKGGRDAGAGVGKGLAHGRATESPCDRSEHGGNGKTRRLLGVQDGSGRVGQKQGDHWREGGTPLARAGAGGERWGDVASVLGEVR